MLLAAVFDLEDLGNDVWRGWTPPGSARPDIFGGQVAGQALLAASRTVDPSHHVNSVHCAFLRRGQPALPLDFAVERTRGRTYSNRRVAATQDGKLIFSMLASFHHDEPSREYLRTMPTDVVFPDDLPVPATPAMWDPGLEMRPIDNSEPKMRYWTRLNGSLSEDPTFHECGLLYASDLRAGGAAMVAIGFVPFGTSVPGTEMPPPGSSFGSLDHALWFHRRPWIDDWIFTEVEPIAVRDSRGLVLGTMFDREGRHVATFTQEMFLKSGEPPPACESVRANVADQPSRA